MPTIVLSSTVVHFNPKSGHFKILEQTPTGFLCGSNRGQRQDSPGKSFSLMLLMNLNSCLVPVFIPRQNTNQVPAQECSQRFPKGTLRGHFVRGQIPSPKLLFCFHSPREVQTPTPPRTPSRQASLSDLLTVSLSVL